MSTAINQASRKRLFLSWYIDFLFFMTLWGMLSYFLGFEGGLPFWVPYLIFIVIRAVSGKYTGSIGYQFLGIDKESGTVSQNVFERETWLTMLLGVLFILEGTKQLVRWTQMFVLDWERCGKRKEYETAQLFLFMNPGAGMRELFLAGGALGGETGEFEPEWKQEYEQAKETMRRDGEKVFAGLPILGYAGNVAPSAAMVELKGFSVKQGASR